ncbi:MAG: Phospho-N-acetylmuramoyl-pentapeptide-transferase [Thermoanaerobacterales bacterium 50_218]|nr:MAG: Phospho-N-acetylmuramoyl-pentapeptide-transferase [Thermoanaerobacterales bacterium 50_218]HAA90417.1 phospho-N-acetylmuramoyl-pentapeptide-transferase [Peptococcaceae bacterium]
MVASVFIGITFVISAVVTWVLGPVFIPLLYRLRFGQEIRQDGPRSHLRKQGTATMGGFLILAGVGAASLLVAGPQPEVLLLLGITFGCSLLGFIDDFLKVVWKRPLGLKARMKLLGQFILGCCLAFGAWALGRGTLITIPFVHLTVDLGFFYHFFVVLVLMAVTNAVNLTDGLDGLASGLVGIASLAFVLIAWRGGQNFIAVFAAALAGGCFGFLKHNYHPARVFMGDTGSLALGGGLAGLAVLTRSEVLLLVLGGVFVVETLSVILQVISFRLTGRRLFRMSPLHHHYELKGWPEPKVVHFFWFLGLCFALLAFVGAGC